jgi:Ran-binding protein 3
MKRKVRQISQGVEDISWRGPAEPVVSEKDADDVEGSVAVDADVIAPITSMAFPNGKAKGQDVFDKVEEEETPPKTPDESQLSQSVPDLKTIGPNSPKQKTGTTDDAGRLRAFSESNEKGLKRKFLERGTSQGPPDENEPSAKQAGEPLKRPRDDSDKDDNPRETKRPSPPPSPSKSPSFSKSFKPVSISFIPYIHLL